MSKRHCEDFATGSVAVYGPRLVTREEIVAFAAEFDPQPMHLDEAAAGATLLGGLAASGWHSCCLLMRMIADGFVNETSSMGAPGVDEVRWLKPLRPGTHVRVRATVVETRASNSRPDVGFVNFLFELLDEQDNVLITLTSPLMLRPARGRSGAHEIFRGHPGRRAHRHRPPHLQRRRDQGLRGPLRSAAVPSRRGGGANARISARWSPPAGTPRWSGCG